MKKMLHLLTLMACFSFGMTALPGCDDDDPIEEAGEEVEDELDDATDED